MARKKTTEAGPKPARRAALKRPANSKEAPLAMPLRGALERAGMLSVQEAIVSASAGLGGRAVLALDLGTQTGFALGPDTGGPPVCGVWKLSTPMLRRYEGGGMPYLRLKNFLHGVVKNHDVGLVVYEEVRRHIGTAAAHAYGGFKATVLAYCEESELPVTCVPVAIVKQVATGRGNASKDDMVAAYEAATGAKAQSDDEADAYWVLHAYYALAAEAQGGGPGK